MNFNSDSFSRDLEAQGFDQVVERLWDPLAVADSHTHPFDAADGATYWVGPRPAVRPGK